MKPPKRSSKALAPVRTADVVAMFQERFKRGPWPKEADCFRLAVDITSVKCARPQAAKYADGKFAERLADIQCDQEVNKEATRVGMRVVSTVLAAFQVW